jgi:D-alanyl-D-alanine carboxypeptidase/D-alanyl-D-alanine-endopeptidase (penicillin-binding protein 4)
VRGINDIAGDVILDRSAFDVPATSGNFDDKPLRPYNVGPDALLVNFRALRFTLLSEGGKVKVLMETPSDGLVIDNRLQIAEGECGDNWKDRIVIRPLPEEGAQSGAMRLEFTGNYSRSCQEKTLNLAPLAADAQVGGLFRALWRELGGSLSGAVRSGTVPASAVALAEQESPSLADTVRDINKFSNNVMARQLYLTLGNTGPPASAERARRRIGDWLAGRGLSFAELELENGSGLSRRERISAQSLTRLLLDAWKSPVMPEFVSSLPIVGIDGTMKKRLKDSGASGRAHIKSGTLDGVKTAAGYALDSQGRCYAVTFLINDPRAQQGQAAIDALLLWVAQQGDSTPLR